MTDRYKGFLITLEKEIRDDDAKWILNALKFIKGVASVKPYVMGMEDWMMYEKGVMDTHSKLIKYMQKPMSKPE